MKKFKELTERGKRRANESKRISCIQNVTMTEKTRRKFWTIKGETPGTAYMRNLLLKHIAEIEERDGEIELW